MALLFMEGFEEYSSSTDLGASEKWSLPSGNTVAINSVTGRYGGKAGSQTSSTHEATANFTGSGATFYCGFAALLDDSGSANEPWFYWRDGTIPQTKIYLVNNASNLINIRRGDGTTLASFTAPTNTWFYFEIKVFMNNSTGTLEAWLDGNKEVDLTSQDTLNGTTTTINQILWTGQVVNNVSMDDIYIGDTTGSDMTDLIGDCHIEMVSANANGTTNNFTASPAVSNYLNVDEGTAADDDTTYNHSTTAAHKELYGCAALTGTNIDTIYAVEPSVRVRKIDAGERNIDVICRSSATEVDSSAKFLIPSYRWYHNIYENDPNGGINWTESAVNACEIGLKIN